MSHKGAGMWTAIISMAIRKALDERGIELTWEDTEAAAKNVLAAIEEAKDVL